MVGSFWAIAKVLMLSPIRGEQRIAANIKRIGNAIDRFYAWHDLLGFGDFEPERLEPKLSPVRLHPFHFQRDEGAVDIA